MGGRTGSGAYFVRRDKNSSTPSNRSPDPKHTGKSFRRRMRRTISPSDTRPVSMYASRATSSSMAKVSSSSAGSAWHPSPKAVCKSSRRAARLSFAASILVTKMKVGTRARRSRDQRVSVWAWTPSVPLMTKMATSMAAMARSVSPDRSA